MASDPQALKVLYLSAEVVPFAKTGGLADVAGALPKAIRELGHDIRVCMPRYGRVDVEKFGLTKLVGGIKVPMDERFEEATVLLGHIGAGATETPVWFIDNSRFFDRQGIYMYPDDAERFIFFSRACLETCRALNWQPDVIHCNEWHTALVPNWLKAVYKDDPFSPAPPPCTPRTTWNTRASSATACWKSRAWPTWASSPIPTLPPT